MGDQRGGGIAWTDETWNPIRGCTRVSPGCENCYAERTAIRSSGPGGAYEGLVKIGVNGQPTWTRKIRFVNDKLTEPLHWKRGRRVFVNSMSDLFHEGLNDIQIAEIFAVMGVARRHTYQVLTKRAERMRDLVTDASFMTMVADGMRNYGYHEQANKLAWPLFNVWLGVSVEDQKRADERIPFLQETPAACRFLSCEPLLEPVLLNGMLRDLSWVIVGGESGPRARPYDFVWAEEIRRECLAAGVAYFHKQAGANPRLGGELVTLCDSHGKDPVEWPEALRVQDFPAPRESRLL